GVATPQLAATLAGGAIGGPTTSAVASGAGAFTTEYGQTILDALQDAAGGNLRDVDAVARALGDEEVMSAAKERAVKRGVPIAIFDTLTAGIAGQIMRRANGIRQGIAASAGEVGVQSAGGMAGEAT